MKITCNRSALAEAFALATTAAPGRSPKEILQNVKLSADGDTVTLSATDMEIGIRTSISGVQVDTPGTVLLPVQRTSSILRESSDETIAIESLGGANEGTIRITGERSTYKLPSANPDEFPSVRSFDGESYHEIESRAFATALTRTVYAADAESSRYALGGVKMESTEAGMVCVGTDGRRLTKQTFSATSIGEHELDSGVIIPVKAVQIIRRALPSEGLVHVKTNANDVLIRCGDSVIYARLVEGRYPNWRQVLPDVADYRSVTLSVGVLGNIVRQASIVTDHESRGINLTFAAGKLTVEASTAEIGDSRVDSVIAYDGPETKLTVDHRYVSDICKVLDAEAVLELFFSDALHPIVLSTDDGYDNVIMPMSRDK